MNESAAREETTEDPVFATAAPASDESAAPASTEAAAPEEAAQPETTAEGAEARADLYKGMYDGDSGAAANDNAAPAADGAQQGGEQQQGEQQQADGEKSTLDKLKDTAISAGSKFGLKQALKLGAKVGGGLGGALAGGAVGAVENFQAYRDGKISGLRAIGNTAVDAATGALPLGLGTVARWGLKKLGAYKPAS